LSTPIEHRRSVATVDDDEYEELVARKAEMSERGFRLYGYRWVVLAVFMLINLTIQMLWIAYAPTTGPAARFYGVTDLQIGLLTMSFMIAFIPLSIPVSWAIDTIPSALSASSERAVQQWQNTKEI
jgi:hypothetical protein